MSERDHKSTELLKQCTLMEEYALDVWDEKMFFKYHRIALRLIEYRINLISRERLKTL